MNKTILEPLKVEISENRAELKAAIIPLVRGGVWSFIPVCITYILFKEWGQQFPRVLWSMPLVLPPLVFLHGVMYLLYPIKYVFTEKAIEERSSHPKKVKWHNVNKWWVEHKGEWLYVVFDTGFLSKTRFRFHESRGEDHIVSLIKQYGKM